MAFRELNNLNQFVQLLARAVESSGMEGKYWEIHALISLGQLEDAIDKINQYSKAFETNQIWCGKFLNLQGKVNLVQGILDVALGYYTEAFDINEQKIG